jgi:hypothetical protein
VTAARRGKHSSGTKIILLLKWATRDHLNLIKGVVVTKVAHPAERTMVEGAPSYAEATPLRGLAIEAQRGGLSLTEALPRVRVYKTKDDIEAQDLTSFLNNDGKKSGLITQTMLSQSDNTNSMMRTTSNFDTHIGQQ